MTIPNINLTPDRPAIGHCVMNTTHKFVSIPKCASTYAQTLLVEDLGWDISNFYNFDLNHKTNLIILRDPISRWISGMIMYFEYPEWGIKIDLNNPDFIFNKLSFDPHTHLQTKYTKDLNLSNSIFFKFNDSLGYNFANFLNRELKYNNVPTKRKNDKSIQQENLLKIFNDFLTNNTYKEKLLTYLKPDLDMFNKVTYYNE